MKHDRPGPQRAPSRTPIPIREMDDAWQVHRALIMAELLNPGLSTNPRWRLHRMDAYEDFHNLFAGSAHGL